MAQIDVVQQLALRVRNVVAPDAVARVHLGREHAEKTPEELSLHHSDRGVLLHVGAAEDEGDEVLLELAPPEAPLLRRHIQSVVDGRDLPQGLQLLPVPPLALGLLLVGEVVLYHGLPRTRHLHGAAAPDDPGDGRVHLLAILLGDPARHLPYLGVVLADLALHCRPHGGGRGGGRRGHKSFSDA